MLGLGTTTGVYCSKEIMFVRLIAVRHAVPDKHEIVLTNGDSE